MAVAAENLRTPEGPIEDVLFPGETTSEIDTRLEGYLTQADAKLVEDGVTGDAAKRAWALYLAFDAAYLLLTMRPAEEDNQAAVLGSVSYDKDQRQALKERAQDHYIAYVDIKDRQATSSIQHEGTPSHGVQLNFDW